MSNKGILNFAVLKLEYFKHAHVISWKNSMSEIKLEQISKALPLCNVKALIKSLLNKRQTYN